MCLGQIWRFLEERASGGDRPEAKWRIYTQVLSLKDPCLKVVFRHSVVKMEKGEEVLRKEGGFGPVGGHQGRCEECLDEEFDIVVVAAPQTRDKTKIAGAKYQKQC